MTNTLTVNLALLPTQDINAVSTAIGTVSPTYKFSSLMYALKPETLDYFSVADFFSQLGSTVTPTYDNKVVDAFLSLVSRAGVEGVMLDLTTSPLLTLMIDIDLGLILTELYLFAFLATALTSSSLVRKSCSLAHHELVTLCTRHNVSIVELACMVGSLFGLIVFDLVLAVSEDDSLEVAGLALLGLTVLTSLALGFQSTLGIFAGFSSLGGPALLRAIVDDGLNLFLGFLRVAFCFVRYVFYDLQGEMVDFAFHGTDVEDLSLLGSTPVPVLGLSILVDLGFWVVQALLALIKLGLAFYLFWLMLDTFLLRPLAAREVRSPLK